MDMADEVYEPREDTWLLLSALEDMDVAGKRILDMGTGSGALAHACATKGGEVLAVDLSREAVIRTGAEAQRRGLEVEVVRGDLFSALEGRFDFIVFNPPYLPSQTLSDRAVDGGPDGTVVLHRFLEELSDHLGGRGLALILLSSLNDPSKLFKYFPHFEFEPIKTRSLFLEELIVFRVRGHQLSQKNL